MENSLMTLVRTLSLAACLAAFAGSQAYAAPILVTSAAALGANDSADISGLGADYTQVAQGASVTLTGDAARSVAFTNAGQLLARVDEGGTWGGNFDLDDPLLWSGGFDDNSNPVDGGMLTLTFVGGPVRGVGARVQALAYGPFAVTITAYNGNTLLGSVQAGGLSTGLQDGSANFVGILDTTRTITRVTFAVANSSFAIDGPQVNTTAGQVVPEPLTLSLLGLGLAGAIVRRSRSKEIL